jgi:hypothetical protein
LTGFDEGGGRLTCSELISATTSFVLIAEMAAPPGRRITTSLFTTDPHAQLEHGADRRQVSGTNRNGVLENTVAVVDIFISLGALATMAPLSSAPR